MEVNLRIAGAAGQGMQTTAEVLGKVVTRSGLHAFCYSDAESRIRGGLNFSHLRLAPEPRAGVRNRIDILVAHSEQALDRFAPALEPGGLVLAQGRWGHPRALDFSLEELAGQAGSPKAAGSVAAGALVALLGLPLELAREVLARRFAGREELVRLNHLALQAGARAAAGAAELADFGLSPGKPDQGRLYLSGGQALALGAVAGGLGFMAAYPMSPSTSIITNLAAWGAETGIVSEQAEDEIAAINMVAGAAYAGARAMTATSGGGFCLMTEGVSLLGMIEAPAVIVVAQRPGPATGLPTRQAQGDLNLVRHAGHGFFPRIILAPRDIGDCFQLTARALDLAERYQCPVFLLTDQHLQDSQITLEPPNLSELPRDRHFLGPDELEAMPRYRRYQLSEDGISPMAAPGVSRHLVLADSDEHDETGHIIEDADSARAMAQKRLAKAGTIRGAAWPPELEGDPRDRPLIVTWGSSYSSVAEARRRLAERGLETALLTLRWLWPLPAEPLASLLEQARQVVVVENSPGCELAGLLREVALHPVDQRITRCDGRPLDSDQLARDLARRLEGKQS